MNKIFALACILYLSVSLNAQSAIGYTRIIDGGSIRSTPLLCENEKEMNDLIAATNPDFAREICQYAEENNWPSGIDNLDKREKGGRELMKQYNMYYVADIGSYSVLLWVPMEVNQHMPADMRDKGDFLVLIGKNGVELGDKVPMNGDTKTETSAETKSIPVNDMNTKEFESQLASIVADFPFEFKNIKGNLIPQRQGAVSYSNDYNSTIVLSGSERTYVSISTSGDDDPMLISAFGDFNDTKTALVKYREIVDKIDRMAFACCTFEKTKETVDEMITDQCFLPSGSGKNIAPGYENIVIQVDVIKTLGLDSNGKLIDKWGVVLKVYSRG